MSQTLTVEHFDETMGALAQTLANHGERLTRIEDRLTSVEQRLVRVEDQLTDRDRIDKLETRLSKLAALTGHVELSHS